MPVARADKFHIPPSHRDVIRGGAQSSMEVIADWITKDPVSPLFTESVAGRVIDVGTGEGHLPALLRERGVDAIGIDGDDIGADFVVDFEDWERYPTAENLGGTADLVVCLEVAEHVSHVHSVEFVSWLCSLGDVVLFSAALPGQGGDGHVNERPTDYWVDRFEQEDYVGSGALRARWWRDPRLEWWYRQNLLLFWSTEMFGDEEDDALLPLDGCPTLIHPEMWQWHHGVKGWTW